jgi:hypothetical protein
MLLILNGYECYSFGVISCLELIALILVLVVIASQRRCYYLASLYLLVGSLYVHGVSFGLGCIILRVCALKLGPFAILVGCSF